MLDLILGKEVLETQRGHEVRYIQQEGSVSSITFLSRIQVFNARLQTHRLAPSNRSRHTSQQDISHCLDRCSLRDRGGTP